MSSFRTVSGVLRRWAQDQPHKPAFSWLDFDRGHRERGRVSDSRTFLELDRQADTIAYALRNRWKLQPGDRALLVYVHI